MSDAAVNLLIATMKARRGQQCVYSSGTTDVVLTVWASPQPPVMQLGPAVAETYEPWDWMMARADLTLGDPLPGDRLVVDGRIYEVLPSTSQPCFSASGSGRELLRVHTKYIGDGA